MDVPYKSRSSDHPFLKVDGKYKISILDHPILLNLIYCPPREKTRSSVPRSSVISIYRPIPDRNTQKTNKCKKTGLN